MKDVRKKEKGKRKKEKERYSTSIQTRGSSEVKNKESTTSAVGWVSVSNLP